MSRLTVVVPAFNVEDTLRMCVESIVQQGVEGMEIIIIDDGSTDATPSIADDLAETYANVAVVHQENEGLSVARNSGIDLAQGEVITFVDSDDWLKADTYAGLLALLDSRPDCDILEYSWVTHDGQKECSPTTLADVTYNNGKDYWINGQGYAHAYAWNKLFRRRLFFDEKDSLLRFEVGRTFEDTAFLAEVLRHNPTIVTTHLGSYVYRKNPQGITARATATDMSQLLDVHLKMLDELMPVSHTKETSRRRLTTAEEDYYMSVLNIQITVCSLSGVTPQLPYHKVTLRANDLLRFTRLVKKILLTLCGVNALCYFCGLYAKLTKC